VSTISSLIKTAEDQEKALKVIEAWYRNRK
jgi:hypothetical protein